MGEVIFVGFMVMGALAMCFLGYVTGYHDGLNDKEEEES